MYFFPTLLQRATLNEALYCKIPVLESQKRPLMLEHFVARNWYLTFLHAGAVHYAVLMQEDPVKASK